MYSRRAIKEIVNTIYNNITKDGLNVKNIILFGSYAENRANENSDIDLAIISDDFTGIRFLDFEKIIKYIINYPDIEIHPYKTEDFNDGNPFVQKIKKNSIVLH